MADHATAVYTANSAWLSPDNGSSMCAAAVEVSTSSPTTETDAVSVVGEQVVKSTAAHMLVLRIAEAKQCRYLVPKHAPSPSNPPPPCPPRTENLGCLRVLSLSLRHNMGLHFPVGSGCDCYIEQTSRAGVAPCRSTCAGLLQQAQIFSRLLHTFAAQADLSLLAWGLQKYHLM